MTAPPTVTILLSTYNGERFLRAQLDSLLAQDYPAIRIRVRDDGSADRTPEILSEYAGRHPSFEFEAGTNLGIVASFFELLGAHGLDTEFVAFCDQDDVWEKTKVSRAVAMLSGHAASEVPSLYFSRLKITDDRLNVTGMTRRLTRAPSFGNALTQNVAAGCTMLLNRAACRRVASALPRAECVVMHDWWIYMVVSAFGYVLYDEEARILYRQHAANFFGASTGVALWWRRLTRALQTIGQDNVRSQLREFSRLYQHKLTSGQRRMLETMIAVLEGKLSARLRCSCSRDIYRQGWIDDMVYRLLVATGRR